MSEPTRTCEVTLAAHGAWEVWTCEVPLDADAAWVCDHFDEWSDKTLRDSGADAYAITGVDGAGPQGGRPRRGSLSRRALDPSGEAVVALASGWTLRSGVYDPDSPGALTSGEFVRLCRPDGSEYLYWDKGEWAADPALVMGAIINSCAGLALVPREAVAGEPAVTDPVPAGDHRR